MLGKIPKKIETRIKNEMKKYVKILQTAKSRDINESDTVIIVSDILCDIFGFDKYSEITTEFAIRGTYCDLAVKEGDKVYYLIEVKAIGLDLKENHLKQAIGYAANAGIEWVILTNGHMWEAYRLRFKKPIEKEKVFSIDLIDFSPKNTEMLYELFTLTKHGMKKSAIEDFHDRSKMTNKYVIAALIQSEPVQKVIIRELKKLSKGLKVDPSSILNKTVVEVLKREVSEGDEANEAKRLISKSLASQKRAAKPPKKTDKASAVTKPIETTSKQAVPSAPVRDFSI